MSFVEVAVELPVRGLYHYALPEHLAAAAVPGTRVVVPFGNRGVSGVVVRTAASAPAGVDRVLPIDEVVDDEPQVGDELLALCLWIADYYEAPPGEVLRAALPVGTRRVARPRIGLTPAGQAALEGQGGALPRRPRD
ncbi:MAG TPA: hypothetical protein VL172_07530, partial [Kofleriaceae bacterium]|nr:hypothetical protein [Kofleriaceae bacterium]